METDNRNLKNVIVKLTDEILEELTEEEIKALTEEQLQSLTEEQIEELPEEIIEKLEIRENPKLEHIEEIIEKEIETAEQIEYSKYGRAIIEIALSKKSDLFSPYCVRGYEMIHPELQDFIMRQANNIPLKDDIQIAIYSKEELTEDQKDLMSAAIRRDCSEQIATTNNNLRRNTILALIMLTIGASFQIGYIFSVLADNLFVLSLIFELISWVCCWEAINQFMLVRPTERLIKKRYLKLIAADIRYYRY